MLQQVQNLQIFKGIKVTESLIGQAFIYVFSLLYSFPDFTQNGFKQLTVNKDQTYLTEVFPEITSLSVLINRS